jgi:hypothetical protein
MPTPTVNDDPMSKVHAALWSALTGYTKWANLIRAGNRVRFDEGLNWPANRDRQIQPGDTAEVRLEQGAFTFDLYNWDASTTKIVQSYPLVITAEDHDVIPLNRVKWLTLAAIKNAGYRLGLAGFVARVTIRDGKDSASPGKPADRGSNRWVTLLTIDVDMIIPDTDLAADTFTLT